MPANPPDTFVTPEPAHVAKSAVEAFAEKAASQLGYAPGADLESIVVKMGGEIRYGSWDHEEAGSLEVYPGEKPAFLIRLSAFAGNRRNRFTIAHELGHYFLHSKGGKARIRVARAGSGRIEWEANWFAGAFLLPEKQFRRDWEKYAHNTARLAGVYQVSEAVVEIRVENLGLTA